MTMLLLTLLAAAVVGLVLAVAIDVADRGEHVETWIEDAHPLFARPTSTAPLRVLAEEPRDAPAERARRRTETPRRVPSGHGRSIAA